MFDKVKENFFNVVTSRLFVLIFIFFLLGLLMIQRIFTLQIVNGEEYLNNFTLKIKKEISIPSTRGNIYDKNGELIAYNELAYSVTMEDVFESGKNKNPTMNAILLELIHMIEQNGDKLVNDFNIVINASGKFSFTVEDKKLLRFLADVYGEKDAKSLSYEEQTSTPDDVVNYLAGTKRFAIGNYEDPEDKSTFKVGMGYTQEELLKILTIRYALSLNSYQKYIPTTIASDISEKTLAVVMENSDKLEGVAIAEGTIRRYVDSVYTSHILGYTGRVSKEELDSLLLQNDTYTMNDMIGKAGIEQKMELDLQGKNGSKNIYVDNQGKIIDTTDYVEPIPGNDLHLTVDMKLQKAIYNIIEQKIAGILITKIVNIKNYDPANETSASNVKIPLDDVFFALINNNVIDINHFKEKTAGTVEAEVLSAFQNKQQMVFNYLNTELMETQTPYNMLPTEYQVYQSYIVEHLMSTDVGILQKDKIDKEDKTVKAWTEEETISLTEYLNYIISKNWIDITKLDIESKYSNSTEIFDSLNKYLFESLNEDGAFSKKIYKYMIKENSLTGKQVCLLLDEQSIVDIDTEVLGKLESGTLTPYSFMISCIENLEITPAQLALDPCSASFVMTDTNTGEVLALVTYPSYDNNRLANAIDSDYFAQLNADLSKPLWDYATQQRSAPGSTFKMVSAVAGLEEGIVSPSDTITCLGAFDKLVTNVHRCWINPGSHGSLNITDAIANSCNYYFYEMSYRMSMGSAGYNSDKGINILAQYANMFGLGDLSGVEIVESEPKISTQYSVPSAIGQGNNDFTTVGLARYVTTVANSGTCFELSLLDKLTDSNGALIKEYTPEIRNEMDVSSQTWNSVHNGMRKVVEKRAYFNDLGVAVAGKTGTAQENKARANHALFVGYAPFENPEIAFATRIAFGYTSDYAAEITRDIISYYYGLASEEDLLNGTAKRPDAQVTGGD